MDIETDQRIRQVVREQLRDQTVLAIAHRIGKTADDIKKPDPTHIALI